MSSTEVETCMDISLHLSLWVRVDLNEEREGNNSSGYSPSFPFTSHLKLIHMDFKWIHHCPQGPGSILNTIGSSWMHVPFSVTSHQYDTHVTHMYIDIHANEIKIKMVYFST